MSDIGTGGLAAALIAEQDRAAAFARASGRLDAAATRSALEHRLASARRDDLVACLAEGAESFGWETARARPRAVDHRYRRGVGLASSADDGAATADVPLAGFVEAVVDVDTGIASVLRLVLAVAMPDSAETPALRRGVEAGAVQGMVCALRAGGTGEVGWQGCGLAGAELLPSIHDMPGIGLVEVPLAGPAPRPERLRMLAVDVTAAAVTAALRDATGFDDLVPPVLPAALLARLSSVAPHG